MREASEKSTSASVASASARTVELVLAMSISSRTLGPTRSPIETNTIAGVIGDPDSRFETAATAISASATVVSDQSIQIRSITVDLRPSTRLLTVVPRRGGLLRLALRLDRFVDVAVDVVGAESRRPRRRRRGRADLRLQPGEAQRDAGCVA